MAAINGFRGQAFLPVSRQIPSVLISTRFALRLRG